MSWPGASAAQQPDTTAAIVLDSIVVSGTRSPHLRGLSAASVTVVGRGTIEADGAPNVLRAAARHAPGLFLQTRGTTGFGVSPGAGGAVSIRGVSGQPNTRVLVLIDGQPQFMGLFGHPIADTYLSSDVERVEVVRGPAAARFGTNAMAGAINLITRTPDRPGAHATLRTGYGSAATLSQGAAAGYRHERWSLFASLNHDRTEGVRRDRDDAFRMLSGSAKGTFTLSDRFRLQADASLLDARFNDPGPLHGTAPSDSVRDYLRGRVAASATNDFGAVGGALMLYRSFGEHDFSGGFASSDVNAGILFFQHVRPIEGTVLTLGLERKWHGGRADVTTPGGVIALMPDERLREFDAYALAEVDLLPSLHLSGGLRRTRHSRYGAEWIPSAGAAFRPGSSTRLRISAAKGFRSPLPVDLFIGAVANPELQPERLWSYEAGAEQYLLRRTLRVDVALFRSEGSNLIQVVGGPGRTPRRQNTGTLSNRGVEVEADYAPRPAWRLSTRYAYVHLDAPALLAPEHDLRVEGSYRHGRYRVHLGTQWVDGLYTRLPPDGAVRERYLLVDARVDARLRPGLLVYARGENLLDRSYHIDYGYPMPGATLFVGAELRL